MPDMIACMFQVVALLAGMMAAGTTACRTAVDDTTALQDTPLLDRPTARLAGQPLCRTNQLQGSCFACRTAALPFMQLQSMQAMDVS